MSFRWTPGCCCSSCKAPCIPDCREIFRGFYNQPIWLGPYQSSISGGVYEQALYPGVPGYDYPIENKYVHLDITESFDNSEDKGNCVPFIVNCEEYQPSGLRRWVARRKGTSPGRDWRVVYSYNSYRIGVYSVTVRITGATAPWANTNLYDATILDDDRTNDSPQHVMSMLPEGEQPVVFTETSVPEIKPANIRVHNYDGYLHSPGIVTLTSSNGHYYFFESAPFSFKRLFCLPFNICEQPFCFPLDVDFVELEPPVNYVPISGINESGCPLSCHFDYPESCGIIIDSKYRKLFSPYGGEDSLGLTDYLESLATPAMADVLDYVVVRLYGFGSPVKVTPGSSTNTTFFCDIKAGGAAVEFACAYVKEASGNVRLVAFEDISLKDCELTVANWNPNYNLPTPSGQETPTPDYPLELLSYAYIPVPYFGCVGYRAIGRRGGYAINVSGGYKFNNRPALGSGYEVCVGGDQYDHTEGLPIDDKYIESRVVFGTNNTEAFAGTGSVGSPSKMPNIWHSPTKDCAAEDNINSKRFNGIWWAFAAVSPCDEPFPQRVTQGMMFSVPLGEFTLDNTKWEEAAAFSNSSGLRVCASELTLKAPLGGFNSLSDFSKSWKRIGYRNGRPDTTYQIGLNSDRRTVDGEPRTISDAYITKPQNYHLVRMIWRIFRSGYFLMNRLNDPAGADPTIHAFNGIQHLVATSTRAIRNNSVTYVDVGELYEVGVTYGGAATTTPPRASYGDISNLDKYEVSVNGGQFITLTENSQEYYVPYLTKEKLYQYFGENDANAKLRLYLPATTTNLTNGISDVEDELYYYPRADFQYIAVWEPDN